MQANELMSELDELYLHNEDGGTKVAKRVHEVYSTLDDTTKARTLEACFRSYHNADFMEYVWDHPHMFD